MADNKKKKSILDKLKKLKPKKKKTSLEKKPTTNKKPGTKKKLDAKTKNFILFGSLALILIIITILVVIKMSNANITYVSNFGDIKTSIVVNQDKSEVTFNVDIQGEKVSQTCEYVTLEDNSYEFVLNNETLKMTIEEDNLTLIYNDGTVVKYTKE